MSVFTLKIIACISMVLDHIKYALPITSNYATIYLGRIAFPLFAFLVVEGYVHTKDLKKYLKRLLIFALISQVPFMLFRTLVGEYMMLNVMFTMILGLFAIMAFERIKNKLFSIPVSLVVIFLGYVLKVDYSWFGVATILVLYIFRDNEFKKMISFIILTLIYYYSRVQINLLQPEILGYYFATISSLIFICSYNGKLGRKMKYFFYWFYPIHMIVLYLSSMLIK